MNVLNSVNADHALHQGLNAAIDAYDEQRALVTDSRNGRVLKFTNPVASVYLSQDITLFNAIRDSNPFFSVFESLWMLAGRNDTKFVTEFVKNMQNYSDDGITLNGAYGHRWRHHFGFDQIQWAVDELTKDPGSRRVNIQMWDPFRDPQLLRTTGSLDVPCNTNLYLELQDGQLNMLVANRSNDLIWGAYGANLVHFSLFQQYIAQALQCKTGVYTQMSRNAHIYLDNPVTRRMIVESGDSFMLTDEYQKEHQRTTAMRQQSQLHMDAVLLDNPEAFDRDLAVLFKTYDRYGRYWGIAYETDFMNNVAEVLGMAHHMHKIDNKEYAVDLLDASIKNAPNPWLINAKEWIQRRL